MIFKHFYSTKPFSDPHLEQMPEVAFLIEFPWSWNSLFSKNTKFNSFFKVSIENHLLVPEYILENLFVYFLRQKPDRLVLRKNAISSKQSRVLKMSTLHL